MWRSMLRPYMGADGQIAARRNGVAGYTRLYKDNWLQIVT